MPGIIPPWNGKLVIYAHGYVTPTAPLALPAESGEIASLLNLLGYAFATTSYSTNGLAVLQGVADVRDLVDIFIAEKGAPDTLYLIGPSEGSLVTTLAVEQYPEVFDGGLAMCGPIGSFRGQVDYFGDFRVVFDYFFPGLIPGSPISITQELMDTWDTHYSTVIEPAILDPANAVTVTQLLTVTQAAYDPADSTTISSTIYNLLWYNIFATNDAQAKLGGQPFDNTARVYSGSEDDAQLNAQVQRFAADAAALSAMGAYQTHGALISPLVTQHTTLDPVVPYWHAEVYRARVVAQGRGPRHDNLPVARYGHCGFEIAEVQNAFALLESRVANPPPLVVALPVLMR
jgi:pimeloyl-ACP methyl ester carboxylesterase